MLCPLRPLAATVAAVAVLAVAARAADASEFIYRSITLPRGEIALDLGLGLGHRPTGPDTSETGFGMNLEISGGVTHNLELGVRTGFRLDGAGQRTQADAYGRPFDTETYGTLEDRVANPELHLRWKLVHAWAVQLGLELRAYLPIEAGSRFGLMFGLPVTLRAGPVRLDTGVYVPVLFYDPTRTVVSFPLHLWIQASSTFWLGPIFGIKIVSPNSHTEYPLGFGLGSALTRGIDLRTWFLFPDINHDQAARTFGAGVALEIRF
jgi:hypothetical protein